MVTQKRRHFIRVRQHGGVTKRNDRGLPQKRLQDAVERQSCFAHRLLGRRIVRSVIRYITSQTRLYDALYLFALEPLLRNVDLCFCVRDAIREYRHHTAVPGLCTAAPWACFMWRRAVSTEVRMTSNPR